MKRILKQSNSVFIGVFCAVFVMIFSNTIFYTTPASLNSVEQWINLTNQMFYGKHDFMFSYGPIYWLTGNTTSMFSSYSYIIAKLYLSTMYGLFWAMIGTLVLKYKNYLWFFLVYILFFHSLQFSGVLYLLPLAFIYFIEYSENKPIKLNYHQYFFIGLYIGFSFYIRFYFGVFGLLIITFYLLTNQLHRGIFLQVFAFIIAVMISYLLSGYIIFHNSVSIIDYFVINNQLNYANSIDMTLPQSNSMLCFIMIFIAWVLLNIFILKNNKKLILVVNLMFLMLFKMGFSRADHYFDYFIVNIIIVGMLFLMANDNVSKGLAFLFVISIAVCANNPGTYSVHPFNFGIDFRSTYQDRVASTYQMFKLPDDLLRQIGNDTIDVYPYNNEYVFANKLNYNYRPSFQNYMTLTPKLDYMNQKFFEDRNSPDYVLWTPSIICSNVKCNVFDDFDEKYILNEDPLTSSTILLNYHVLKTSVGKDGTSVMLFERNKISSQYQFKVLKQQSMKFNTWYDVPSYESGVLKIVPNIQFSLFGKVKNLLFKGDLLYINYKLSDGTLKRYRLNILNTQSGVWVSPLIKDFDFNGPKVTSILFEVNDDNGYFNSGFNAQWINIPINLVHSN